VSFPTTVLCPMEEDLGMFMWSVVVGVHLCGREGEKKGKCELSKGTKNGAVDSEHEASKGRDSQLCTKSRHSK
jgi:hypothetical protein